MEGTLPHGERLALVTAPWVLVKKVSLQALMHTVGLVQGLARCVDLLL